MNAYNYFLALLFTLISSNTVFATVSYNADATSSFTLIDAGGMSISASTEAEPTSTFTVGTGIASIDADTPAAPGSAPFITGTSLSLASEVSGSASAGFGTSEATVFNSFLITLTNSSTSAATAIFSFEYSWLAEVFKSSAVDAPFESGFASAFFHLDGFAPSGDETLAIDLDGIGIGDLPFAPDPNEWLVHPETSLSMGDAGPSSLSGTETVYALVTVPGESIQAFSVITDATGSAAYVPNPAPILLIGLGYVLLNYSRKKQ